MYNRHTLPWLLKAHDGIDNEIRSAQTIKDFKKLLKYSLDINQLRNLSSRIHNNDSHDRKVKVAILSNSNLDYITPSIKASSLRYNLNIICYTSTYDSVASELLDIGSDYFKFKPDVTFLYLNEKFYDLKNHFDKDIDVDDLLRGPFEVLNNFVNAAESIGSTLCVSNLVRTYDNIFGQESISFKGSSSYILNKINNKLTNLFIDSKNFILDINSLASDVGNDKWFSKKHWYATKTSLDINMIPLFSDYFCRAISALYGKTKKCIVLDLDNTLWGGIVGEVGKDNIELGDGTALGEAYRDFQKTLLDFRSKGILLAIASKNNFDVAIDVFRNHNGMLITEDDIASFKINWNNKAENIIEIANELNIGLDSIIFLDDNPAERYIVSSNLPDVTVLHLPDDPVEYSQMLTDSGFLEQLAITKEDLKRADNYKIDKKRKILEKSSVNYTEYLRSLEMSLEISEFKDDEIPRISQLCNKSNQFNLTTKRYTENDIKNFIDGEKFVTLQLKLNDKFSEMGIIGLVIGIITKSELEIDTWLMSCRVLKREIEKETLNHIMKICSKNKIKKIVGKYLPTKKNIIVKNHYPDLGFTNEIQHEGYTSWNIDVEQYKAFKTTIKVDEFD
tara:strand:- start:1622 stop:3478 length:1857 start_codon:yes stop_codon:yes gene_type:complete